MANTITIPDIQEYTQQILDGALVLTRINPFVDEATLFRKDLRGSSIEDCKINNVIRPIRKYNTLLIELYSTTNVQTILQNTILNISQEQKNEQGFKYYSNLGLSIQGAESKRTLREIIKIVRIKNYSMELKIKLKNDEIVRFVI
jgi:hypothetical protein